MELAHIEDIQVGFFNLAVNKLITNKAQSDGDTNCNWRAQYRHQRIGTRAGELVNKRTSGDHLSYSIVDIGAKHFFSLMAEHSSIIADTLNKLD